MFSIVDKHDAVDLYLDCSTCSPSGQTCGLSSLEMGQIQPQTMSVSPVVIHGKNTVQHGR